MVIWAMGCAVDWMVSCVVAGLGKMDIVVGIIDITLSEVSPPLRLQEVSKVILRMRGMFTCAKYKLPQRSNAHPEGLSVSAKVAKPLSPVLPAAPVPTIE